MAGRPSRVAQAGLDATLTETPEGKWKIVLTDGEDAPVFQGTYVSEKSAKDSARTWVRDNYEEETREVRASPRRPRTRTLGPLPSNLVQMMRDRADDNEERAISFRAQADTLEAEAKRLRVSADSLEGPGAQP